MCFLSYSLHMLVRFFSHLCLISQISSIQTEYMPTNGKFCKNRKIFCICYDKNIVESGILSEEAYIVESSIVDFSSFGS